MSKQVMLNLISDLEKITFSLKEVLVLEKTEITRDSAIKKFEISFDLAWKSMKIFLQNEGVNCFSPRSCIKEAFRLKLIEYDEKWLDMIDNRNRCVHIYSQDYADEIYDKLENYLEILDKLILKLKQI